MKTKKRHEKILHFKKLITMLFVLLFLSSETYGAYISGYSELINEGSISLNASTILDFITGNFSRMYLTQTGDVGIGTTNPGSKLHVLGNINATGNITSGTNTIFIDGTNSRIGIGTLNPTQALSVVGDINITGTVWSQGINITDSSSISSSTSNPWNSSGTSVYFNDSNANLGIGTSSPKSPLHVYTTANNEIANFEIGDGNSIYMKIKNNASNWSLGMDSEEDFFISNGGVNSFEIENGTPENSLYIADTDATGMIGIGTSDIETWSSARSGIELYQSALIGFTSSNTIEMASNYHYTGGDKFKASGYAGRLQIGNGNLKYITSTTSGTADAVASFRTPFIVEAGASANSLVVNSSGNVGIGTKNPVVKLHVQQSGEGTTFRLQDSDGTCNHDPDSGSEVVSCSSDEKLKEDIKEADNVLDDFEKIEVKDYTVKKSGRNTTGVIAQEINKTNPEMVHEVGGELFVEQPNPWKLLKAIQELKQEFDSLAQGNYTVQINNTQPSSETGIRKENGSVIIRLG